MKTKFRMLLSVITFIAALALLVAALALPLRLAAQYNQGGNPKHHHYKFIDLGTFGGPTSVNFAIYPALNNSGTVIGRADTSTPGGNKQRKENENNAVAHYSLREKSIENAFTLFCFPRVGRRHNHFCGRDFQNSVDTACRERAGLHPR